MWLVLKQYECKLKQFTNYRWSDESIRFYYAQAPADSFFSREVYLQQATASNILFIESVNHIIWRAFSAHSYNDIWRKMFNS